MTQQTRTVPAVVVRFRLRFLDDGSRVVLPPGWDYADGDYPEVPLNFREYAAEGVVTPLAVNLSRTPVRHPDVCRVSFDAGVLPVDPRSLRAIGIEVFADAITPAELQDAERQGRALFPLERKRLRFIGTARAEDWLDDQQTINITARDFTQLLMESDLPAAVAAGLDVRGDVVSVVQEIVDACPAAVGLRVLWVGEEAAPGIAEAGLTKDRKVRIKVKPKAPTTGGAETPKEAPVAASEEKATAQRTTITKKIPYLPVKPKTTYWDAITDIVVSIGCVAMMDRNRLLIGPARTVFASSQKHEFRARINCDRIRFQKQFGRTNIPGVLVVAWDTTNRRRLIAVFPPAPFSEKGGERVYDPRYDLSKHQIQTLSGVTDQAALDLAAEAVFHEVSRQQVAGSLSTIDMHSLGKEDAAFLSLKSGSTIDLSPPLPTWEQGDIRQLGEQEIVKRFQALGVKPEVASELARRTVDGAVTTFWTTSALHTWATQRGWECRVSFAELPVAYSQPRDHEPVTIVGRAR